jgi:hypothetical protein
VCEPGIGHKLAARFDFSKPKRRTPQDSLPPAKRLLGAAERVEAKLQSSSG